MRAFVLLAPFVLLAGCAKEEPAAATEVDPAADLVASIEAIKIPILNPSGDRAVYQAKYEQAWQERAPLVQQLAKDHPDHPKTAKMMDEYWQSLMQKEMDDAACDRVIAEIDKTRANSTNGDLRRNAAFWSTFYASYRDREDITKVLQHAEKFSREFPMDARGATIYSFASMSGEASREQMEDAFEALIAMYPNTEDGQFARAMRPLLDNVDKPFDFDFTDAVTGKRHTDEMYRGKVLVIDWWATWCGPCIESLPRMKEIYAKYKDKGVEYIGVSLDQSEAEGGLKALRDFVKKEQMTWPQYHLNGDPAFQQKYKVAQIPSIFVVDKTGKVVSIDGYRTLERTLQNMLGE